MGLIDPAWLAAHPPTPVKKRNPMVGLFGPAPDGLTCKTCKHLTAIRLANTYYKCALRGDSRSAATDHRVNWPACKKHEEV